MASEQTFIAIKPDGVQRRLIHEVIKRFEQRGYKLVAMKMVKASPELLEEGLPFLPGLVQFMASGPLVAMVWEGPGVIADGRRIIGATRPSDAAIGTIRGDFCIDVGRNLIHGSDGPETAQKEINLWFKREEIVDWSMCGEKWILQ